MKAWPAVALGAALAAALAYFLLLASLEPSGSSSVGFANAVGIAMVFMGIVFAALLVRRRATPP